MVVEIRRCTDLLQVAGPHDGNGVGHRHGFLLVMRDMDEGDAHLLLDPLELDLHLPAQLEVERAEGLVEQQDVGFVDDGAGKGDPLLHAAGQLPRTLLGAVAQLHQLEGFHRLAPPVGDLALAQAETDVVEHAEVREQRVALEHRVHLALVGAGGRDVVLAEEDLAGGGLLQPGDHPQGGGLAAAGRAEESEERAARHQEVEAGDSDEIVEVAGQLYEPEVPGSLGGCHD